MPTIEELKDFPGLEAAFRQMVDDGLAACFSIANRHYLAVLVDITTSRYFASIGWACTESIRPLRRRSPAPFPSHHPRPADAAGTNLDGFGGDVSGPAVLAVDRLG